MTNLLLMIFLFVYDTAMQAASKTLYECMSEVYEPDWNGHDLLTVQSQTIEMHWQDLSHKMADQVLIPLNTYQSQFPEMRVIIVNKINKQQAFVRAIND